MTFHSISRFHTSESKSKSRTRPPLNTKALIVIQGAPGLGKNFIGPALLVALRARGLRAVTLQQNTFGGHDVVGSGAKCLDHFAKLLAAGDIDAVVLLRNNAKFGQFRKYAELAQSSGWAVHAVAPRNFGSDLRALAVCLSAGQRRGVEHPTFGKHSAAKKAVITVAFFAAFRRARLCGEVGFVSDVDWFRPQREEEGNLLSKGAKAELRRLLALAAAKSSPFELTESDVDAEALARALGERDYDSWRLDVGETVDQIVNCVERGGLKAFQWKELAVPDPWMLYSYAQVPSASYDSLLNTAAEYFDEDAQNIANNASDPHVTLIFSDPETALGKYIWSESIRMAGEGESVRVVVDGLVMRQSKLLCFTCDLFSIADGQSLNGMVQSRHPHIIGMLSNDNEDDEILRVLKALKCTTDSTNDTKKLKFKETISFEAEIKICIQ